MRAGFGITGRLEAGEGVGLLDHSHNWLLVAASLAVALMAGFSGLSLTRGASALGVAQRKLIVVIAAIVLGGGIWSMHFVAMLGLRLPILFYYDGLITLISALIAILMVGIALLLLHFGPRTPARLVAAGGIVGLGIAAMHYVGMMGMELCRPVFSALGVGISLVAAVALSVMAIWIAYGARTKGHILLGTVCFALSVFAVHFIAMMGTGFVALDTPDAAGPALSNAVLAMGVTVAAFMISGTFLLTGVSFLAPVEPGGSGADGSAVAGAGGGAAPEPGAEALLTVPFEKEGRTQFLDRSQIAAVRAEGHYTILYAGAEKLFCPWSISEAESRLAPAQFLRAHRSYLVNPAFVTGFERTKDSGALYFEDVEALPKVPVSRSRLPEVRAALGL
ncbi:CO-responsive transcriptional regulator RcoM [Pseudoruegeria aquimaris]|uniref:CO-responsive transcriptional regulator RcoM n=1 Tax=Pseudoruegeria aquimaris TaxID=393663 RepID=A0A1Y5RQM8_9RHOB|nr:MHYT domain-containing protein [Pseudoruegeria aquimaris]SLN22062.1 CO-responsive transcriptional regulator RcoM [Pseudoruegeria aquimaris]